MSYPSSASSCHYKTYLARLINYIHTKNVAAQTVTEILSAYYILCRCDKSCKLKSLINKIKSYEQRPPSACYRHVWSTHRQLPTHIQSLYVCLWVVIMNKTHMNYEISGSMQTQPTKPFMHSRSLLTYTPKHQLNNT